MKRILISLLLCPMTMMAMEENITSPYRVLKISAILKYTQDHPNNTVFEKELVYTNENIEWIELRSARSSEWFPVNNKKNGCLKKTTESINYSLIQLPEFGGYKLDLSLLESTDLETKLTCAIIRCFDKFYTELEKTDYRSLQIHALTKYVDKGTRNKSVPSSLWQPSNRDPIVLQDPTTVTFKRANNYFYTPFTPVTMHINNPDDVQNPLILELTIKRNPSRLDNPYESSSN